MVGRVTVPLSPPNIFKELKKGTEMKKILIAIPCMEQVSADFAHSLAVITSMPVEGATLSIQMQKSSLIYESRNTLCKNAIQNGADYIMWFDSDMILPADTIQKMYQNMKDGKDFVSGVYYRRVKPYTPVLFKELELNNDKPKWTNYDNYPKDRLFKVGGCGFGCVMFNTQMLFDIASKNKGWFTPFGGLGEDLAFCQNARDEGYDLWVDPSIQCGHCGSLIVTRELYESLEGKDEG